VVIAANHTGFRDREVLAAIADSAKGGAVLADPWDCFDTKQVFSQPAELVAATHRAGVRVPLFADISGSPWGELAGILR
jgi:UDP-N-acetyl-D-mannosaminuronic acid dehydrogenase